MDFINWIKYNSHWLFSGTGVFAIALFAALITSKYSKLTDRLIKNHTDNDEKFQIIPDDVDNLSRLLIQNFQVLNRYYSENFSQARISTLASLSIAIIGFLVIIAGVLITFIGEQIILGTVSSGAGVVSEVAALLFFNQNKLFLEQMQGSLKKLVSTQYLMTSIALTRDLPEEERAKEIITINDHLRKLMDILHQGDVVHARQ